jgi:hypothetical protein
MLTPRQYRDAIKEARRLRDAIEKKAKERDLKEHHLKYDVYRPKITALENELFEETNKVTAEFNSFKKRQDQIAALVQKAIEGTKDVLSLIETSFNLKSLSVELSAYRDKDDQGNYYRNAKGDYERRQIFYTPIDTIAQDQYKDIQVFIVRTKKPTNKYALTIQGRSIFKDEKLTDILPRRNEYINGLHENTNIRLILKEASTIEALQKWYARNKAGLLKDFLIKHADFEVQYEAARAFFKSTEWKILYIENLRERYHQFDNEYEDYTTLIKILSGDPKDLALLVSQMKTEDGKKLLERLLKE